MRLFSFLYVAFSHMIFLFRSKCRKNKQGSVLGPILFVLYTHPISEIVSCHSLSRRSFSDDDQLNKSGNITQLLEIIHSTQSCISDVKTWMTNNQLQLNNDKTEMILIATKTVLHYDIPPRPLFHSPSIWRVLTSNLPTQFAT